jgi:uncharacterized protein
MTDYPEQHLFMQTFTGQAFDPLRPDPNRINIADIAHALSMSCRYGGHVHRFYSVAEHSLHVSSSVRATSSGVALWGLLHDASEAYIADIVRPAKKRMPEYQEIERNLMWAICKRFDLPIIQPAEVSDIDLRLVIDEKTALLGPAPAPWGALEGLEPVGAEIQAWMPYEAEARFLERFAQLYSAWA